MPVEIEAKMKVDSLADLADRLRDRGATHLGQRLEVNAFFDTSDRTLLAADQGLRLRVATDLQTNQSTCVLTHKGPNQHGPLKTREETELSVADADAAERLLARLGYSRMISFEKRRDSWQLADCHIELDEVPYLGSFVEIEGPSDASILKLRALLGLADRPLIRASYIAMLADYLQERGDLRTEIGFT
jgi:adenylate cyclase, class 2